MASVPAGNRGWSAGAPPCRRAGPARGPSPPPTRLVRDRRLRRHAHADEVVYEPLEVVLRHHVRDEEARDVALLPHPRHEPAVTLEHRLKAAIDLDAVALAHREATLRGQHDVADEVAVDVAIVHGEAALAGEVHGLGGDEAQPIVAGEGPAEVDARLLRQPRQAGGEGLRLARPPPPRPRGVGCGCPGGPLGPSRRVASRAAGGPGRAPPPAPGPPP